MVAKEAKARLKINKLLHEAGWRLLDDERGVANVCVELSVKIARTSADEFGDDFEKSSNGFVDFLLLDSKGRPFIVLEAKSESKDPLIGKEQARQYARSLNLRYVILSNGNIHYFWDIEKGNPQIIVAFPTLASLESKTTLSTDNKALVESVVKADYIAETIMPNYAEMPAYINELLRPTFVKDNKLRFLRPYQLKAIEAMQRSAKEGNTRFLFEMATGTGKTLTAAAIIKLFLRSNSAQRILFLVDRIELEKQGCKNFYEYLKNDYVVLKFRDHQNDWIKARIVVSTVQTLLSNDRYRKEFSPTDFDLVISDEAHRSINGNSRALFEYFVGYKLGLTATPKDYIKNVDVSKLKERDPRNWERRQLLDTYKTFGCESGEPTFRYSLTDGVKEGYLINPYVIDARTDITTELLAEQGYSIMVPSSDEDDDEDEEQIFFQKDFEKKFFSDETNFTFCKTFLEKAKRDPISGEIGKSIVFCVSRKHATKITNILNEIAMKMFPNKYESDFAMQVTSDIPLAQNCSTSFTTDANNLSGKSKFVEGYKTSKTRVCVTVGMMTTGYDCEDLLNIVLMRPIFSPSDYVQIKGRGTRKFTFSFLPEGKVEEDKIKIEKDKFFLFDFFGNYEYFEHKHNYDAVINLPKIKGTESKEFPPINVDDYTSYQVDEIKSIVESQIDENGMRVDRELFAKFEEVVKNDKEAKDKYDSNLISELISYIDEKIMNKPKDYFSWEKLRKAIMLDRKLTKKEMLDKIFGAIKEFATKNEVITQEFEKFILTNKNAINSGNILIFKKFFEAYLSSREVRNYIDNQEYKKLHTCQTFSFEDLTNLNKTNMLLVLEYISDNINMSKFAS